MLVVALGSITVVAINARQALDLQREQNEALIQQARSLAMSGERFASVLLMRDVQDDEGETIDSLEDDWAQTIPPIPVDNATITGCVIDMQGRFNLNNLVAGGQEDTEQFQRFQRLLQSLGIPVEKAEAVVDWLDTNVEAKGASGAESDYYTSLDPGYRAANRPMVSVSELQQVRGFGVIDKDERRDYETLLPHVAALPRAREATLVNVNTATPEVIGMLDAELAFAANELSRWDSVAYEDYPECENLFDLSAPAEDTAADGEDKTPFPSVAEFNRYFSDGQEGGESDVNGIDVKSNYFQVRIDVATEGIMLHQYTLFKREDDGKTSVLMRSRDAL